MIDTIAFALWFFLPAGAANMAPVIAAKLPGLRHLDAPIDMGKTYRGARLLGAHKTWRGLAAGVVAAVAVVWLQQEAVTAHGWFAAQADATGYTQMSTILLGFVFAAGALGGDAVKSFFKRRLNKSPGQVWLPYGLVDHIIGAALLTLPFVVFAWWAYLVVVCVWLGANLAISYAAYLLRIKERPL